MASPMNNMILSVSFWCLFVDIDVNVENGFVLLIYWLFVIDGSEGETEFEKWHIVRIVNFCWMLLVHESGSSYKCVDATFNSSYLSCI